MPTLAIDAAASETSTNLNMSAKHAHANEELLKTTLATSATTHTDVSSRC